MRPAIALFPLFALGCAPGPNAETLLYELRVVQATAEPPEVAPGETLTVTATIADPTGAGAEAAVWLCTPAGAPGAGCLEDALAPELRAVVATPVDETVTFSVAIPAEAAALVADTSLPTTAWTLACAPGACPLVDDIRRGEVDPAAWSDPGAALAGAPLAGVSLAARNFTVSLADPAERNANPVVTAAPEPALVVDREGSVALDFTVADADEVKAYGFSTDGGFGSLVTTLVDGEGTLTWYAPAEKGTVALYVAFEDGRGGSALWRGTATVQ